MNDVPNAYLDVTHSYESYTLRTGLHFQQKSGYECPYSLEIPAYFQSTDNLTELEILFPCEVREYLQNIKGLANLVDFLFNYFSIFLVVVGLILNTLSFLVIRRPPLNKTSLSVYLRGLAISDNCALLFHITVSVLRARYSEINEIYENVRWMCLIQNLFFSAFFIFSDWLIVSLTYGRLWSLRFPLSNNCICKRKFSTVVVILCACICLMLGIMRSQFLGFDGLEKENPYGYASCQTRKHVVWSKSIYLYVIVIIWFPLTLIIIGNVYLLIHVRKAAKQRASLTNQHSSQQEVYMYKLTRLLLTISGIYVILFIPIGVMCTVEFHWLAFEGKSPQDGLEEYVAWKKQIILIAYIRMLCLFIYLWNFVINFFVYCVSGVKFRNATKELLSQWLSSPCLRWITYCKLLTNRLKKLNPVHLNRTVVRPTMSNSTFSSTVSDLELQRNVQAHENIVNNS